jgi:N-acyl-D-glutamate deacylase
MDAIRQASLNACFILEDCCPSFKKKGRIQVGCDADLIVFDPETVTDMGTFPEGLQLSKGMKHVLVNGTFLIHNEVLDTEAYPGRAMRVTIKE